MARVNPTEFAILGLLAQEPRSGYDIKKEVESRLSHFWSESYGHIYPMLRRLHDRDLVVKEVERQDGRPDRKVYHITDDGLRTLRDWFSEPPPPPRPRNEFLLRLFLGHHAPPGTLVRDARNFREGLEGALERLRRLQDRIRTEASSHPERMYWELVLDYGVLVYDTLSQWARSAEATLREVEQGEATDPDG